MEINEILESLDEVAQKIPNGNIKVMISREAYQEYVDTYGKQPIPMNISGVDIKEVKELEND